MSELDHKEGWALKIDAFKLLCLRRLLRAPWISRDHSSQSIGYQPLIFIGRTDAEAEAPPNVMSQLVGSGHDVGKHRGQEEKGQQRMRCLGGIAD